MYFKTIITEIGEDFNEESGFSLFGDVEMRVFFKYNGFVSKEGDKMDMDQIAFPGNGSASLRL